VQLPEYLTGRHRQLQPYVSTAQARVSNAVSEALDFHKSKDKSDEKTA